MRPGTATKRIVPDTISENYYGLSETARGAAIRAVQIDPADMTASTVTESDVQPLISVLAEWRMTFAKQFINGVCTQIRKTKPYAIAVIGEPDIYRYPLRVRSRSLNDWLSWSDIAGVEEVVFPVPVAFQTQKEPLFSYPLSLLEQAKKTVGTTALFLSQTGRKRDSLRQLQERLPARMATIVEVTSSSDVNELRKAP